MYEKIETEDGLVRRRLLESPGDALLPPLSFLSLYEKLSQFAQAAGIDEAEFSCSNMVATPIPLYPDEWGTLPSGNPRRRWDGVKPEIMWHPLMWMPDRVAFPYGSTTGTEPDDIWMIRVALEMSFSRLYDPATGAWVDVLDMVGLDVDNPVDLARVEDWLAGEPDELLDNIDLGPTLEQDQHDWAFQLAVDLLSDLLGASYAVISDDLADLLGGVVGVEGVTAAERQEGLEAALALAVSNLSTVPSRTDFGEDTGAVDAPHKDFFAHWHAQVASGLSPAEVREVASAVLDRLLAIRESHWGYLDRLAEIDASLVGASSEG